MIKGIIFDFDGLIINTETHQFNVYHEKFLEYGFDLPLSRWQEEIGTQSGYSPCAELEKKIDGKVNKDILRKQVRDELHARLLLEKARPGVEEYLKDAKNMGLKIGLATSSNYEWVSTYLKMLNLTEYFECIKTSNDVEKVKPDPALYEETAKCLGLNPVECLVFEDSANGAMAAKRAGMSCVIVPNEVTETMDFCAVEHRLQSMTDMYLIDVIDLVTHIQEAVRR